MRWSRACRPADRAIAKASHNHQGAERACQWLDAAHAALDLYAGHPAVAFADLAAEIATEVRLLRAIQAELAVHAAERETAIAGRPDGLARTPARPGRGRRPRAGRVHGRPGPVPPRQAVPLLHRAGPQGLRDRGDRPQGPAHVQGRSSLLRTTLVRAADTARKQDPQLARIYYVQMTDVARTTSAPSASSPPTSPNGPGPSCAAAQPYVICDTDGRPVTAEQAKTIIAERWTVPPDIRARRRSKKTGKAPQKVLEGQHARGYLRQHTTPPRRQQSVKRDHLTTDPP